MLLMKQRHELKEKYSVSSFHGYTGRCIRSTLAHSTPIYPENYTTLFYIAFIPDFLL
jgi:hypothetical protein